MKRLLTLTLLLTVAGCEKPAPVVQPGNVTAPAQPKPAPAPPAKPFKVAEKGDVLDYGFGYPAEVAAIPTLAATLTKDAERVKVDALKMARDDRESMKESGFPFNGHELQIDWTREGATPRFLSLLQTSYAFTGGAHGMTGYTALLWDKETAREAGFTALTTSAKAFAAAISARFCKALDDAREEKRGAPVVPDGDDFNRCVDPMQQTLVATSSNGKAIDGLTVVIGQYEAGPYSEGAYEIALPFDAAMLNAIRPDYRPYFAVGR